MEHVFIQELLFNSNLKMNPYDWVCGPGSKISLFLRQFSYLTLMAMKIFFFYIYQLFIATKVNLLDLH